MIVVGLLPRLSPFITYILLLLIFYTDFGHSTHFLLLDLIVVTRFSRLGDVCLTR